VSEFGNFQILLIDDHPSDAKLFEHAMAQSETRAKVYWVATAEEGLEFLKREGRFGGASRPKLVVADLNMPAMDGFAFLQEARGNPAISSIPIVIFSSSRAPKDVLRAYRLGANSFITKPMSLEAFVATIGTLVRYWLDIAQSPDLDILD
jgi:two-component system, chemotaxis family, response regulator Rcp1